MKQFVLDSFEDKYNEKVTSSKALPGFPQPDDFEVSERDVDEYVAEKQAVIDSLGSEKQRLTKAGIIAVIPIVILSVFPDEEIPLGPLWGNLLFLLIGIVLAAIEALIEKAVRDRKLAKLHDERIERYIDAVMQFGD